MTRKELTHQRRRNTRYTQVMITHLYLLATATLFTTIYMATI